MSSAPISMWVAEPPSAEVRHVIERCARAPDVQRVAVMPDVHLGEGACVGVAIATRTLIYPAAIGTDIGCGMAAVALDADIDAVKGAAARSAFLQALWEAVPIVRHRTPDAPSLDLDVSELSCASLARAATRQAPTQLGTLGRGNHFIELQADEEDRLWLMVHSGSRVMGELIAGEHQRVMAELGSGGESLDTATDAGRACERDLAWATRFAECNRAVLIERAARAARRVLGVKPLAHTLVDLPHNTLTRERHFGQEWLIHRKGVAPAHEGMAGLIPGSMGTASYHVVGRGHPDALRSSSHGAGRRLSRGEARRAISARALAKQAGHVTWDPRMASSLVEEAPAAYKPIDEVMRAQHDLVGIVRRLRPIVSFKGP